jgi:hypothetical protein
MTKFEKSKHYSRCLSCFSDDNCFDLNIKSENGNFGYTVTLCCKCIQQLGKEIKILTKNEVKE